MREPASGGTNPTRYDRVSGGRRIAVPLRRDG